MPDVDVATDAAKQMLALRVLRLVAEKPDLTQRQLAEALGVSLGRTNFLVQAVLARGWIKIENFRRSSNKLGYIYVLTPQGLSQRLRLTQAFIAQKELEYVHLRAEIETLKDEITHIST